jgi:glyoxylase I family protein
MPIEHVLAVVPVSDLERADAWYEALFGRPADNRPMPSLVEWQVTGAGWVQVTVDTDRAGSGLLNLAVDDLLAIRDELATRGVETTEIQLVNKGVELSATSDPDGNAITLIGNFREKYCRGFEQFAVTAAGPPPGRPRSPPTSPPLVAPTEALGRRSAAVQGSRGTRPARPPVGGSCRGPGRVAKCRGSAPSRRPSGRLPRSQSPPASRRAARERLGSDGTFLAGRLGGDGANPATRWPCRGSSGKRGGRRAPCTSSPRRARATTRPRPVGRSYLFAPELRRLVGRTARAPARRELGLRWVTAGPGGRRQRV